MVHSADESLTKNDDKRPDILAITEGWNFTALIYSFIEQMAH